MVPSSNSKLDAIPWNKQWLSCILIQESGSGRPLLVLFILCIVLSDPPALNHGLGCGCGVTVNRLRAVRFLESKAGCWADGAGRQWNRSIPCVGAGAHSNCCVFIMEQIKAWKGVPFNELKKIDSIISNWGTKRINYSGQGEFFNFGIFNTD